MDNLEMIDSPIFKKENIEELNMLLHGCIDEICDCTALNFHKFTLDWSKSEFLKMHKFFFKLLQNPTCLYAEAEKMPTEYHGLPDHVQKALCICLRIRRNQLVDALLKKYSSQHLPTVTDFDWRLKYIMGSSKIASVKEPVLQLDLMIKEKEKENILDIELNKEELDLLINTLEVNSV